VAVVVVIVADGVPVVAPVLWLDETVTGGVDDVVVEAVELDWVEAELEEEDDLMVELEEEGLEDDDVVVLEVVDSDVMLGENVPGLPALSESPPYAAVIVGVPPAESVYVTEHRPAESAHWPFEGLNVPVLLVEVKLTVPPGENPPTTALQLMTEPTGADAG
jgi:hypothetical protein